MVLTMLGFFAHWATRGQRDFASVRGMVTGRYELMVADSHAAQARELLSALR